MSCPLVAELAADGFDVTMTCRLLGLPRSSYYAWQQRAAAPCDAEVAEAHLANVVFDIHAASAGTYGAPRVHAELTLGLGLVVNRKRTARLLRVVGRQGIGARRKGRRVKPAAAVHDDLVQRRFTAAEPDRIWCTDVTEHPTAEGKVYCCAVLDVWSRMVVGWSIADHARSELVVDALEMARWSRRPGRDTTICHSDRGAVYTSWIFGHRLRQAGLLGSMGRVASSVDNTMIESFWSTMQRELLGRRTWATKAELGTAIFEWIEGWTTRTAGTPASATSAPLLRSPTPRRSTSGVTTHPPCPPARGSSGGVWPGSPDTLGVASCRGSRVLEKGLVLVRAPAARAGPAAHAGALDATTRTRLGAQL